MRWGVDVREGERDAFLRRPLSRHIRGKRGPSLMRQFTSGKAVERIVIHRLKHQKDGVLKFTKGEEGKRRRRILIQRKAESSGKVAGRLISIL